MAPTLKRICVLGSTGSIGEKTIQVVGDHPDRFEIVGLSAHESKEALVGQVRGIGPAAACLSGNAEVPEDSGGVRWFSGPEGLLDLIEASILFAVPPDRIDILVHPQSIVHSLVRYIDGSVLAQMGTPDMRTPIASTLAWPERMVAPSPKLDLAQVAELTFEEPDLGRFPALSLARECLQTGGGAPTILNAANEVAVKGFLDRQVGFLDIVGIVEYAWDSSGRGQGGSRLDSFEDVNELDQRARVAAESRIIELAKI